MRLRLPYRIRPDGYGGTFESVYCQARLGSPHSDLHTDVVLSLIDSGASRCMFNSIFAADLGLELEAGRLEETVGIGGRQDVWVHPVRLYLPGGPVEIQAGFQEDLPIFGILGMEGFFEHFIVTFDGLARECLLDRIYSA